MSLYKPFRGSVKSLLFWLRPATSSPRLYSLGNCLLTPFWLFLASYLAYPSTQLYSLRRKLPFCFFRFLSGLFVTSTVIRQVPLSFLHPPSLPVNHKSNNKCTCYWILPIKIYGQSTHLHLQSYYLRSNTTMSRFGQASDAFRSLRSRNVPLARAGLPDAIRDNQNVLFRYFVSK